MKHVGLNVAADPFMTLSLTGVNAGLVDRLAPTTPACTPRRTSRTTAHYAKFAKVPMLEPSDSQEAYDYVAEACALSEEFDAPVLLRSTTRISHGRGRVVPRAPVAFEPRSYERSIEKHVMVPQFARQRNRLVLERLARLRERAEQYAAQRAGGGHGRLRHHRVRASPTRMRARPFPRPGSSSWACRTRCRYEKVAKLYRCVSRVAVVEELDPFIEEQVRALGVPVVGKEAIPADGELDQEIVFAALEPYLKRRPPRRRRPVMPPEPRVSAPAPAEPELPVRPPVLCPGCPHRSVFATLRKHKVTAAGRHRLLHAGRPAAAAWRWTAASAWAPASA